MWNEKAELTKKIQLGQIVKVFHGYVRRSKEDGIELHIGHRGDIQISPPDIKEGDFPSIKDFCQKIASIKMCRKDIEVGH